jgi:hypothetical protein
MSQQDTTTIPLEIVNNVHNDHYATTVPSSQFSYELLKAFICQRYSVDPSLFSMNQASRLKLVYKDDCNDDITISSDDELRLSLTYSADKNPLKIYIVSDQGGDKEEVKTYQKKRYRTLDEKILFRYSKPRLYESLNIHDVNEIELYKSKLVELHKMGFKRSKFNLKMMLNLRVKDDFSPAFEEIKRIEGEREKKRNLRYEQKQAKFTKKRKEKICKMNIDDGKMKVDDDSKEEEGYENVITACFDSWPEGKYFYLFIDGNNLLYLTSVLRKNSLRRKHSKSEDIIVAAVQSFASVTAGLGEVNVMFDRRNAIDEKVLDNGSKFFITSARPTFNTTDDAFIELTKRQATEQRSKSLHVTSDRGLTRELCKLGASVMKPKMFFSLVIKKLNDGNDIDMNKWFEDIESKLNMNQNNNGDYQNNNNVNYQNIYQTKAFLQLIGRNGPLGHKALVVTLNDANLPTEKKNPHMTVLFYNEGFTDDVFRFIDEERNRYMQNKECLSFSLSKWGGRSDKIDGELYNFCVHMREKFSQYSSNERPPHVEMR